MTLVVRRAVAAGKVTAPPSKSYTHRAFVAGALAGRGTVTSPLLGEDTQATLDCLAALGVSVGVGRGLVTLDGRPAGPAKRTLDVKNSGTTLRLLAGVACLAEGPVKLTGDASIRARPMGPLVAALATLGAKAKALGREGRPPVRVEGPLEGGRVALPGNVSSQFVSSLLMTCPLLPKPTEVEFTTELVSEPYVAVTLEVLSHHGVLADRTSKGFRVEPGQQYRAAPYTVPGDFSSAAFPLVAAAVTGGKVRVEGLDVHGAQGDRAILDHLRAAGAKVRAGPSFVECEGGGRLAGFEADLAGTPDLFPILSVLASQCRGTTRLYGAPQLKFKESDRIAAMAEELRRFGAAVTPQEDGAILRGPTELSGAVVDTRGDHRVLMACYVAGLVASGETRFSEHGSAAVSYPSFLADMALLGCPSEVVR